MQQLTLDQFANYFTRATITHTHDAGFAIIHSGKNENGVRFILVND